MHAESEAKVKDDVQLRRADGTSACMCESSAGSSCRYGRSLNNSANTHYEMKMRNNGKPKLLIASRVFVVSGQPWLWRQVINLRRFRAEVLCWDRQNSKTYPTPNIQVHVLPGELAPYEGVGRWWYRLRNLPGRNFYAAVGSDRRGVSRFLELVRPDIILCHFGDIAMRLLPEAQQRKIPLVAYFHGDFQFFDNRWYRWSLHRCIERLSAIIVVTEAEKRWLLDQGVDSERIHWIPCGAPTSLFRPYDRMRVGPTRFVMVSRLSPEKGCDLSLRAFARVNEKLCNSQLHLYGDGPKRKHLEQLATELDINDRVIFHGYVDEQQLAQVLPDYDVFIQHTVGREGSPVSVVEAMACGLPVVATGAGDISRQVCDGETGVLIEKGDIVTMASSMLQLARSPDLRLRMGKAARERAMNLYDSSTQTSRLEQVLLGVAGMQCGAVYDNDAPEVSTIGSHQS